jgi:hypothetical protein
MVHPSFVERKNAEPTKKRKSNAKVLASEGLTVDIKPRELNISGEPKIYKKKDTKIPAIAKQTIDEEDLSEYVSIEIPEEVAEEFEKEPVIAGFDDYILEEELPFTDGKNTLKIKFFKRKNRMYCVKVYLNEDIQIRPVTFTGSQTGKSFWQMIKGSLKK